VGWLPLGEAARFSATEHRTSHWIAQQCREALLKTPYLAT
jgi:hypothetical protein